MKTNPKLLADTAKRVGEMLVEKNLTLSIAESCTGGLLSSLITDISGSSSYFEGGIVSYSNRSKHLLLDVPVEMLDTYGAVSEQVAKAMAQGVRRLLNTDISISITGIAGPTGGTPAKPVGLVYICLAADQGLSCDKHIWPGNRLQNKEKSVEAALDLLEQHLLSRN